VCDLALAISGCYYQIASLALELTIFYLPVIIKIIKHKYWL